MAGVAVSTGSGLLDRSCRQLTCRLWATFGFLRLCRWIIYDRHHVMTHPPGTEQLGRLIGRVELAAGAGADPFRPGVVARRATMAASWIPFIPNACNPNMKPLILMGAVLMPLAFQDQRLRIDGRSAARRRCARTRRLVAMQSQPACWRNPSAPWRSPDGSVSLRQPLQPSLGRTRPRSPLRVWR